MNNQKTQEKVAVNFTMDAKNLEELDAMAERLQLSRSALLNQIVGGVVGTESGADVMKEIIGGLLKPKAQKKTPRRSSKKTATA